jgi:hypothetical protein
MPSLGPNEKIKKHCALCGQLYNTYTLSGYYVCDDCLKKVQSYQKRYARTDITNNKKNKRKK